MVKRFIIVVALLTFGILSAENDPFFSGNIDNSMDVPKGKLSDTLSEIGDFDYALLIGADGTAAYIQSKAFPYLKIKKSWGKWKIKAKNLPEVCNIVNLAEIALFKKDTEYSLKIWNNRQIKPEITPFQARLSEFELLGKSSKNDFNARKYKESSHFYESLEVDKFLRISDRGMEKEYNIDKLLLNDFYFSVANDTLNHIWINYPEDDLDFFINNIYNNDKPVIVFHIIGPNQEQWDDIVKTTEDLAFSTETKSLRLTYPESTPSAGNSVRKSGKFSQINSLLSKPDNSGKIYLTNEETKSSSTVNKGLKIAKEQNIGIFFACFEIDSKLRKSKRDNIMRSFGYLVESILEDFDGSVYIVGTEEYQLPYFQDGKELKDFFGYWDQLK